MKTMPIKFKNFILRPFKKGDEKSLQKNINNRKIYKNTSRIPYPYTLKHACEWIDKCIQESRQKDPKNFNFVIDLDGKAVGSVGFSNIEKEHKAEIGYWLGEEYWGRGIMTQAVKLAVKFGFEKFKLKRIYGRVLCFNPASKRVMEKAGFKLEGLLRKEAKKDGKLIDSWLLAKLKD